MRALLRALLDCLPFGPRSRRALDETFADWAHENATASSTRQRVWIDLRAVVAVTRAVVISSLRETGTVPVGRLAPRLLLFAVLPAILVTSRAILPAFDRFGARAMVLLVPLVPGSVVLWWSPAVVLAVAWRQRGGFPGVGMAILSAAWTLFLAGWIVPWSNDLYGHLLGPLIEAATGASAVGSPPIQPTLMDLLRDGFIRAPEGSTLEARIAVIRTLGFAAQAGAAALLAASLARRGALGRRMWLLIVPGVYVAIHMALTATLLSNAHSRIFASAVAPWIVAAGALYCVPWFRSEETANLA